MDEEIIEGADVADTELDTDSAELRVYELAFHIDAELPQEEAKKVYQDIKDLVTKDGSFVAEGEPEKIALAYTISRMDTTGRRDFSSAYFAWIVYETTGKTHAAIIEAMNGNKQVIRFLDLRTTKDAAMHAAEMHEFYRHAPEAPESTEDEAPAAVDTELDAALKEVGVE